ncbi:MAG: metalloprotease PmbA [Gammaproteobacteria bacterium]|nr:metalloprotease PmbA [Gammaproteobacteria bacterium]
MSEESIEHKIKFALDYAKRIGADQSSLNFGSASGFSVTAQNGSIDTVENYQDQRFSISIYLNSSIGSASSNDLSNTTIKKTIEKANSLASLTAADKCNGLADRELMAQEPLDLDLYHPWDIDIQKAQELAIECEQAALSFSSKVINSEGANVGSYKNESYYANSHGFIGASKSTGHSISCTAIAEENGLMEMDYDYTSERHPEDLIDHIEIGENAASKASANLGSKKLKTQEAQILYSPRVAKSIISHLMNAISGGSLYRKSSFLVDCLDKKICSEIMNIREEPHLKRGSSSTYFDGEGVKTKSRSIVDQGKLLGYLLSSYSARRLGMETTGNAGGHHNLLIEPSGPDDFNDLVKGMKKGLIVTGLIGYGVNIVNGDYSRGANGFWVENGKILYPVSEITIAGNLKNMFNNIEAIGSDMDNNGAIKMGSLLINNLMIAGQ